MTIKCAWSIDFSIRVDYKTNYNQRGWIGQPARTACFHDAVVVSYQRGTSGYRWMPLCERHSQIPSIPLEEWAVIEAERQLANVEEHRTVVSFFDINRRTFKERVHFSSGLLWELVPEFLLKEEPRVPFSLPERKVVRS